MEPEARPVEERPAEEPAGEPTGGRIDHARLLRVAAYVLLTCAAALILLRRPEAAFFTAALGVSAWFLNVRTGLKRKHDLVKDGPRNWRPRSEIREIEEE